MSQVARAGRSRFYLLLAVVVVVVGILGLRIAPTAAAIASPATISKSFGAANIPLNGETSLTFVITNPNASPLTNISFVDNLPPGMAVAYPNQLDWTCGGLATAASRSSSVSLSGGTLAANGSCSVTVWVQGTAAGSMTNTVTVSSSAGQGNTAAASLTVLAPPAIAESFGTGSIPLNGTTTLSFTISNPNSTHFLSSVGFTDNLPTGLVVAAPGVLSNTCGGWVPPLTGSTTVSLSGVNLGNSATCLLSVEVQGTAFGVITNTTGPVTSLEGGQGSTASASLTVVSPPWISTWFGAATMLLGGTTDLTFGLHNPNTTTSLSGVGFLDNLPGDLVATLSGQPNGCGGTLTVSPSGGSVSLTGVTLPPGAICTLRVTAGTVPLATAGVKLNTTGPVTSAEGGTGSTASASLNVLVSPSIGGLFVPNAIPLAGTSALSLNVWNDNPAFVVHGVGFTDSLPAGLVVATPTGLTNNCGGTATAVAGSPFLSLTGGTMPSKSSCSVKVNVQATTPGVKLNTTSVISTTDAGLGNSASAVLLAVAPPTLGEAFGAASIPPGGTTGVRFTINNPNNADPAYAWALNLSGIGFTDTLPAGLVVASPNGAANTCGGTATAVAGSGSITLSGGTLAINTSCELAVEVTGTTFGRYTNTTGSVTSANGGAGPAASASIFVRFPVYLPLLLR